MDRKSIRHRHAHTYLHAYILPHSIHSHEQYFPYQWAHIERAAIFMSILFDLYVCMCVNFVCLHLS